MGKENTNERHFEFCGVLYPQSDFSLQKWIEECEKGNLAPVWKAAILKQFLEQLQKDLRLLFKNVKPAVTPKTKEELEELRDKYMHMGKDKKRKKGNSVVFNLEDIPRGGSAVKDGYEVRKEDSGDIRISRLEEEEEYES